MGLENRGGLGGGWRAFGSEWWEKRSGGLVRIGGLNLGSGVWCGLNVWGRGGGG